MSKVYLIGGVDSFGVPYTRDNKNHISFFDILDKYLNEKGIETTKIDMFSMSTPYNDTDYINELLENDITLEAIHNNQVSSIDICRKSGFFQHIKLPKTTKQLYNNLNEQEKNTSLKEIIKNNKVIFIYSCGANDFLKSMSTDLAKLLNPKKLKEVTSPDNIAEKIALIINKIKNNINMLIALNPNIEIYIIGIPIPTRVKYIRKTLIEPLKQYNIALKKLCTDYNQIYYVDNYGLDNNDKLTKKDMAHVDWHPNKMGQEKLGNNLCQTVLTNSKLLSRKK